MSRLPDIYLAAIVLCDLEGRTRKEVANRLGVPEGTVAARVARARAKLAKRLTQRGITLSGGALAAVPAQRAASARVPKSLVLKTIKVASLLAGQAAATGAASVKVAALTEGVLKAMLVSKFKTAMAVLLVVALVFGGAIGTVCHTQAGESQKADKPAKQKATTEEGGGAKTDAERLQGKWEIASLGRGGLTVMRNWAGQYNVTFKGDTVRFLLDKDNMAYPGSTTVCARYRLDPSAGPKAIDLIDGTPEALFDMEEVDRRFADTGEQTHGAYAFDGDTLRLCFSRSKGKKAPAVIENTKESNTILYVLKRMPEKAK